MAAFYRLLTLSLITSPLLADTSNQPATENSLPDFGQANPTPDLKVQLNLTPTQSSQYSSGGIASGALGNERWASALKMDLADKAKRGVFSLSGQVSNGLILSLTASGAQENAGLALGNRAYSGVNLYGAQLGLGLDYAIGQWWLKSVGTSVAYGTTTDTELGSETINNTHYSSRYQGSHWVRASLRTRTDVGQHGELSTRIGGETNALRGTRAVGGVSYQHYFGASGGKASLSADASGPGLQTYSAQYEYPLTTWLAMTTGLRHSEGIISDTQGQFGISLSADNRSSYQRPLVNALGAYQVAQNNLSDPLNTVQGLGNYGRVVRTAAGNAPVPTFTGFSTAASLSLNYTGQLTATDQDSSDTLTYALVTAPTVGTLQIAANGSFTYTGSVMPGSYPFKYSVSDDRSNPVEKTATITVNDVAPQIQHALPTGVTRYDDGGFNAIQPITDICPAPGTTDQLGRVITSCDVNIVLPQYAQSTLVYNPTTRSIEGEINVFSPDTQLTINRTVHFSGTSLTHQSSTTVTFEDNL